MCVDVRLCLCVGEGAVGVGECLVCMDECPGCKCEDSVEGTVFTWMHVCLVWECSPVNCVYETA